MLKNLVLNFLVLVGFSSAYAAPAFQLKDVSYNFINRNTVEVIAKGEKIILEKVDDNSFKVNSQVVTYSSSDSFEQLQKKMEKAYMAGKKRRASLDDLFMPKAEALLWFPALLMMGATGMIGYGLGQDNCQNAPQPDVQPAVQ